MSVYVYIYVYILYIYSEHTLRWINSQVNTELELNSRWFSWNTISGVKCKVRCGCGRVLRGKSPLIFSACPQIIYASSTLFAFRRFSSFTQHSLKIQRNIICLTVILIFFLNFSTGSLHYPVRGPWQDLGSPPANSVPLGRLLFLRSQNSLNNSWGKLAKHCLNGSCGFIFIRRVAFSQSNCYSLFCTIDCRWLCITSQRQTFEGFLSPVVSIFFLSKEG